MTLILSLGFTAAFAEGEAPVIDNVAVEEKNGTVTVTAKAPEKPDNQKVDVTAAGNTVTVVAGTGSSSDTETVQTNDPVTVKVENDVSAGSDSTAGIIYGIQTDGSNVTVEVGTVTATVTNDKVKDTSDNPPSAQAVEAHGSTVDANTVNAKGYDATAVRGYSGSVINVGTATATAVNRALAVDANNSGTKIEVNKAEATSTGVGSAAIAIQVVENATVNAGSATATANGIATAVSAKGDKTVVTVKNDVTAEALGLSNSATAVSADEGAAVTAGSVTATAGQYSYATAVSAAGGAAVTADSAYASAFHATAVSINNTDPDKVSTVTVQNEAKAHGELEATAVDAGKESSGNRIMLQWARQLQRQFLK